MKGERLIQAKFESKEYRDARFDSTFQIGRIEPSINMLNDYFDRKFSCRSTHG